MASQQLPFHRCCQWTTSGWAWRTWLGVTATPAELRFLSGETRKEGWTYLLLEPGLHYLAAHEPQSTNVFAYDARWSTSRAGA